MDSNQNPQIRNQFETGLARGLESIELSETPKSEEIYIGFPLSQTLKNSRAQLGRNTRMLACHSRERTQGQRSKL